MAIDSGVQEHLTEHYDKDLYPILFEDGKISSPVFACCEVKQEQEGQGRKYVQRITTYEGAAVAEDPALSDSIAGDGAAGGRPTRDRWEITPTAMDATFVFSRDDIDAMDGMSPDKQFDVITEEMDLALMRIRNQLCQRVTQKGWGLLAQTTAQSSTGFTVDPAFVNLFPVGKRLVASATEDTDVLSNSATVLRVTAADPVTGVITTSANPVTSWANSATLFIFSAGSRISTDPNSDTSLKLAISGLPAWIDPVGQATIFGITRTGDPKVVGYDINCSSMDTAQGFLSGANTLFNFGVQEVDTIFCSGVSWQLLQQDYDPTKVVQVNVGDYRIGYEGYKLATVFGNVTIIPDPFIAPGTAYAGPFMNKKWRPKMLHSNKNLINLDDHDGKDFERVTTSGARTYKGQFYFRGQLCIAGPGKYAKLRNLPTS